MTGESAHPRQHDPVSAGGRQDHGRISGVHSLSVRVCPGDIDRMGHVYNSVYLRSIEEAVHAHWAALATPAGFAAYLRLAVRHELDYRQPAFAEDILRVETRIVTIKRARLVRDGGHMPGHDPRRSAILLAASMPEPAG